MPKDLWGAADEAGDAIGRLVVRDKVERPGVPEPAWESALSSQRFFLAQKEDPGTQHRENSKQITNGSSRTGQRGLRLGLQHSEWTQL